MARPYVPAAYRGKLVDHETFRLLSRVRDEMASRFDEHLALEDFADAAFLSPFHFHRLFQRAFGETPLEFLTRMRLERAQMLLVRSPLSVLEVCVEVGYTSPSSFSALFERHVGARPAEFRKIYALPERWFLRQVPGCHAFMNGLALSR